MKSLRLSVATLSSLLASSIAGPLLLTGCAPKPAPAVGLLIIPVATTLRSPCPRPARPRQPSVGELAGFSVEQEAAISVCETRKDAAVAVIDAHNRIAADVAERLKPPRPWWRRW